MCIRDRSCTTVRKTQAKRPRLKPNSLHETRSGSNCQITGTAAAGTYTLTATRTGLTQTGASSNVVITAGSATKLTYTTQPVGGVALGTNFAASPAVAVQDSYGNTVTTDTGNVTLAIATGPAAGALTCTNTTVAAVAGVATFTNCQITGTAATGTYTLTATRLGLTATAPSSNVVITAGSATKLAFTSQPVGGVAIGTAFQTSPSVSIQDASGNVVATDTGNVTLAIASGPAAGTLSCTSMTVAAVAGVAAFQNCKISGTSAGGAYTLVATRTGLTPTGASNTIVVADNTAPTVASVVLANHGVAGTVGSGDTATIGFSQPMKVSTFCSAWTGDANTQTLTGVTLTVTSSSGSSGDRLTVTTASSCTFALGTIRLGAHYLSSSNVTFTGSTLVYSPTTKTLTLTLGTASATTRISTGVTAGRPGYTPSSGHQSILGLTLSTSTWTSPTASGW